MSQIFLRQSQSMETKSVKSIPKDFSDAGPVEVIPKTLSGPVKSIPKDFLDADPVKVNPRPSLVQLDRR